MLCSESTLKVKTSIFIYALLFLHYLYHRYDLNDALESIKIRIRQS
jgi:hypothetical protein